MATQVVRLYAEYVTTALAAAAVVVIGVFVLAHPILFGVVLALGVLCVCLSALLMSSRGPRFIISLMGGVLNVVLLLILLAILLQSMIIGSASGKSQERES